MTISQTLVQIWLVKLILQTTILKAYVKHPKSVFSAFKPVVASHVYRLFLGLSSNKATGIDKISSKIIKLAAPAI